jgi:DNA-binding response OmpR family regulator
MTDTRILLVEDDEIARGLIHDILKDAGYAIVDAEDGGSARRILAGEAVFDCILLDRGLPDCDGILLLREFRGDPRLADVPVVMETARGDTEAVTEGIAAGAQYYLTKPIQRPLLLAVVEAAITGAREAAALRIGLREATQAIALLARATFRLRTLGEAREVARTLASLCPDPQGAVLTLQELLINAVEHGNLAISYSEKTALVLEGQWNDEIERRLRDPVLGARWVTVDLVRSAGETAVTIADEGTGFDWNPYLELSTERAFDPNGRGIAMARLSGAGRLEYQGRGNTVTARWLAMPHGASQVLGAEERSGRP